MGILNRKKTTKTTGAAAVETKAIEKSGNHERGASYRTLLRPLVSEKAAHAETKNTYTFVVNNKATKTEIKTAVERVYGVRPTKIHTIQVEGKDVRYGRMTGRRKDWKKALVTLPTGITISIHEGV